MSVPVDMAAKVKARAGDRYEYCGMSQSLQGATFHIEHIAPLTCGGLTVLDNLALACVSCNLRKSDRSHVVDPESGLSAPLYHPRLHRWPDHFAWLGTLLTALTPVGRGTLQTLDLNHPRRIKVREAEVMFGLFPPPQS